MLSSITPLGERSRNNRWATTVAVFVAAATLGGLLTGLVFGTIGAATRAVIEPATGFAGLALAAALAALAFDALPRRLKLPASKRQVNEHWVNTYRSVLYAGGWGIQLGVGWATVVTTASVYLMLVLCVVVGSIPTAALIGTVFGLTRGLTVLTTRGLDTHERMVDYHRRMQAALPRAQLGVTLADALTAVLAAAALAVTLSAA